MSDRIQRLKELRKRRNASRVENKKELRKDYEAKKAAAKLEERLAERLERAEAKDEEAGIAKEQGVDVKRVKARKYTIEEDEEWDQKVREKRTASDQIEFQNYKQLAERTYVKGLEKMDKVSSEEYKKQKEKYSELLASGMTEEQAIARLTSTRKVQALVSQIKEHEAKTYKKRAGKDVTGDLGYINEKNREFNAKVGRFYGGEGQ